MPTKSLNAGKPQDRLIHGVPPPPELRNKPYGSNLARNLLWQPERKNMKTTLASAAALLLFFAGNIRAQTYDEYKFTFSGTAYQTNSLGTLIATHISDQTLLADRARQGGISNLTTVSLVYHIGGDPLGDTVEVISNKTGQTLTTEFGFYFGSDGALGRTAVANLSQTMERRLDYIYTFYNSTYTFSTGDSLGAAFTYKRLVKQGAVTNALISGTMSWSVTPTGTNTKPMFCTGTFSLGRSIPTSHN
jgi:hypothetical protein